VARANSRRPGGPAGSTSSPDPREDRLGALHRQLADGVAAIRDGAAWHAWLDVAARFHHYSFGNQVLIAAQRPDATLVAGYRAWQGMGRHVRKGEKALWVLAPVTVRRGTDAQGVPDATQLSDPLTTGADTDPSTRADWSRGRVVGFRGAPVFDVAQTEGEPLPAPPRAELLAGQAPPGLWDTLAGVLTARGFALTRCPDATAIGGANGITDFGTRTVTLRADVDEAQAVKTLAHEVGHVLLHHPGDPGAAAPACRGLVEVEAESVAYLVTAHHGLDTAGYTFAYVAGWAGQDPGAVQHTASRVLGAARQLIDATDPHTPRQEASRRSTSLDPSTLRLAEPAELHTEERISQVPRTLAHPRPAPHLETLRSILAASQVWYLQQGVNSRVHAAAVTARRHRVEDALRLGVGYAPPAWTTLVDHLRELGHQADDLVAAGIATPTRRGGLIDRFRGRITFPIHDQHGVVGFVARDTTGDRRVPKYLNTPTTPLYDKTRLLFGTQHLTDQTATAVLVEGPWDALAITACSTDTTVGVAACGTAVTEHHLRLAARDGHRLVLAPDPDRAGLASLDRTLTLLESMGWPQPDAIHAPEDFSDVLRVGGPAAVQSFLASARPAGLVYAKAVLATRPLATEVEARVATARAAAIHAVGLSDRQGAELQVLLRRHAGLSADSARGVFMQSRSWRRSGSRTGSHI
jgi:DNA primase catalytic core